jgi:hypothetical protein
MDSDVIKPTFVETLFYCIGIPEFVSEFNRLSGCSIGVDKRTAIEKMIDKATGYEEVLEATRNDELRKFVEFVYEFIWIRYQSQEVN